MKKTTLMTMAIIVSSCGGEAPAADEPVPNCETTEIADGVYEFRYQGHKGLFVATGSEVVAFDPISMDAAPHYVDEIKRLVPGAQLTAIVYSHRDADHATGANVMRQAFGAEVPIIAHENARAPLISGGDPNLPPPDSTFATTMTVGSGEGQIDLHYLGRSHSDDMLVGHVVRSKVAFVVDFAAHDRLGYRDLSSFYFPEQFDALTALQNIPYETIVFGHGSTGDRSSIDRQIQYYRDLQQAVQDAIDAGMSEETAATEVQLGDYAGWGGYEDWRELNVRGMYRTLSN